MRTAASLHRAQLAAFALAALHLVSFSRLIALAVMRSFSHSPVGMPAPDIVPPQPVMRSTRVWGRGPRARGGGQKVHIGGVAHTHLAVSPAAVWVVGHEVVVGGVLVREVCYGD